MKILLEKVFQDDSEENEEMDFISDAGDGFGNETPKELDSLANIRLYSTFLNKAEGKSFPEFQENRTAISDSVFNFLLKVFPSALMKLAFDSSNLKLQFKLFLFLLLPELMFPLF